LEGDRNTTCLHVLANHRDRKKRIEDLKGENGLVQDTPGILKIAADFYKNLFKKEDRENVSLEEFFWDTEDLVTIEENLELEAPFSQEEVKALVFSCYSEGGLALMGFISCFITNFGVRSRETL
jgi:hypothetical protein